MESISVMFKDLIIFLASLFHLSIDPGGCRRETNITSLGDGHSQDHSASANGDSKSNLIRHQCDMHLHKRHDSFNTDHFLRNKLSQVGQLLWCAAHTLYIGTSFTVATSAMLCLHHLFAVWNGDRRLLDKWGDRAEQWIARTSIVPFAAIASGKQPLPEDYYKEFLRAPYLTVALFCFVLYYTHPFIQAYSILLPW